MNTYQENFETTVKNTLTVLENSEQKLNSEVIASGLSLFHAQGASAKANAKKEVAESKYKDATALKVTGTQNENLSNSLNTTITEASKDTAEAVTNMSTAASNIEIAANAIAKVSADIGSMYNLAQATINGSDIEIMAGTVNNHIQQTSYTAEFISDKAMDASANTSEIIATEVKQKADLTKTNMDNLIKVIDEEFTYWGGVYTTDNENYKKATQSEKSIEESLSEYKQEYSSTLIAYDRSNKELNYNLLVQVTNTEDYKITFNPKKFISDMNSTNTERAMYYVAFVENDKKTMVTLDQTETSFTQNQNLFYHVNYIDVATNTYELNIQNNEYTDETGTKRIVKDIFGNPLTFSKTYVALLYIEPTTAYKKSINDYSAILSAPSEKFNLLTPLTVADDPDISPDFVGGNSVHPEYNSVSFNASNQFNVVYHCIFVPKSQKGLELNLTIAEHISFANYTVAAGQDRSGNESKYLIPVDDSTTDCFGDLITEGSYYRIYIISKAKHGSKFADTAYSKPKSIKFPLLPKND